MNTSTWFVDTPILDNFLMQRPLIWTVFIHLHQSASVSVSQLKKTVYLSSSNSLGQHINQLINQHQSNFVVRANKWEKKNIICFIKRVLLLDSLTQILNNISINCPWLGTVSINLYQSASVSISQHPSASVSISQHQPAYHSVSINQHQSV